MLKIKNKLFKEKPRKKKAAKKWEKNLDQEKLLKGRCQRLLKAAAKKAAEKKPPL